MQTLNEYIAAQLIKGTRKSFGGLNADYLQMKRENTMNSGTIQNDNHKGSAADGFNARPDVTNAGSKTPEGVLAQSNGNSTSPTTSGATASSQVALGAVKNTDAKTLVGSHADSTVAPNSGAAIDTGKNQPGPRGTTNDQLEGVGG